MNFLKKLFPPKEVRAALEVLEEAGRKLDSPGFQMVRERVEALIKARPAKLVLIIRAGKSVREYIYTALANHAGDEAESGRWHIHRGTLIPGGPGEDCLRLFDGAVDELVKMGAMDADFGHEQKDKLREGIQSVG